MQKPISNDHASAGPSEGHAPTKLNYLPPNVVRLSGNGTDGKSPLISESFRAPSTFLGPS